MSLRERRGVLSALLLAPAVVFIIALVGVPLGASVYLSLTDATAGSLTGHFVGLDNFRSAWRDPTFRTALRNTIVFTLAANVAIVLAATVLAHFLVRDFRGRRIARVLILLPWAAPVALSTIGWRWIFDSLFSVLNWTLAEIHLIDRPNPPQWLGEPNLALMAITTVHAWRLIPFATVIMIAGFATIPKEVNDAAAVDGANGLRKIWHVSLPLQLPIVLIAVLFSVVSSATDLAVSYTLTNGGPFNSTQTLPLYAFQTGIQGGSLGAGAAVALYLLPALAAVSVAMLLAARRFQVA